MGTRAAIEDVRARLRELRAWADGYEETNAERASAIRSLVYDVEEYLVAYEDERHGREAMQANYERALAVIGSRLYQAGVLEIETTLAASARIASSGEANGEPLGEANPFL